MKELSFNEIETVNGGVVDFGAAGAGGALGGLFATGSLAGAAAGSVLGLAAGAAFSIGFAGGGFIAEHTYFDEWLGNAVYDLLN